MLLTCPDKNQSTSVSCDVRFADPSLVPGAPGKIEVVWPDGTREEAAFNAYNPNEQTTAWFIAFDRSKSLKANTVKIIREDFGKIIASLRSKEKMGIATFADTLDVAADIGASREQLLEALNTLQPIGDKTLIYQLAIGALDVLSQFDADRRALVIVTDGKSEDKPSFTWREVVTRANDLGIVVYSIGYSEAQASDHFVNNLQQIANGTQGPHRLARLWQADERMLSPSFAQYFLDFMQNGGNATFSRREPSKEVSVQIVATIDDGRQISTNLTLPPVAAGFIPFIPDAYETEFLITLATIVVLLIVLLMLLLGRRKQQPAVAVIQGSTIGGGMSEIGPSSGEGDVDYVGGSHSYESIGESGTIGDTVAISRPSDEKTQFSSRQSGAASAGSIVYGWLEPIDESSKKILIESTTVTIGRHQDNDIQFNASTVHRRHANLHMTAEQEFVITNLSGEDGNGVIVNGDRVETMTLSNGDLIELGDVRVRFHKGAA